MSEGDEHIGSDELSAEAFEELDKRHEEVLTELYGVVQESQEARDFLNTKFGITLRKTLLSARMFAMKACAEAKTELDNEKAHFEYEVVKRVETIFGMIISDGNAALRELNAIQSMGDEDAETN